VPYGTRHSGPGAAVAEFHVFKLLVVEQRLPAEDALPGKQAKEGKDFQLQESISVFAAKSASTAFATNHGRTLFVEEVGAESLCIPGTRDRIFAAAPSNSAAQGRIDALTTKFYDRARFSSDRSHKLQ
jgi:hypothetical protein